MKEIEDKGGRVEEERGREREKESEKRTVHNNGIELINHIVRFSAKLKAFYKDLGIISIGKTGDREQWI